MSIGAKIITACACFIVAPHAFAQASSVSASNTVTLKGTVGQSCYLPPAVSSGDASVGGTGTNISASFTNFANAKGAHDSHVLNVTFPAALCNYAASLSLKSANGGMKPSVVAPAGFTNVIHYTAMAIWGAGSTPPTTTLNTKTSSSGDNNAVSLPIISGDLNLYINTLSTNVPLIADGTPYTDTITIQIGSSL